MAALKTAKTKRSVAVFLNSVKDEQKRRDAKRLLGIMRRVTGEKPAMWGHSIVGFGSYHYVYASGREGDWPVTGFSPRKQNLTIYIMSGFRKYSTIMRSLGRHTTGASCLSIKRLDDIDLKLLEKLIRGSIRDIRRMYPA